jgi:hypothetical protein
MVRATHSPVFVTRELLETRYRGAAVIFMAGSVSRGEASAYSDIDLVVVYNRIPNAFRESFIHKDWPVEAFVHDPETIRYFFQSIDRPTGSSTLAEMIYEGLEIPGPSELSAVLKQEAARFIEAGPPALSQNSVEDRRYHISELLDDIRETRSREELIAAASLLYNEILDYYFREKGVWSSSGKSMLRRLKKSDASFARRFTDGFDLLFGSGQSAKIVELTEELLAPKGGVLFENYRRDVPVEWRISK